jgi:hypothetical protein
MAIAVTVNFDASQPNYSEISKNITSFITVPEQRKFAEIEFFGKGEAEAQRLIRATLTPELLQKQAIEKWNGNLPKIITEGGLKLDVNKLFK